MRGAGGWTLPAAARALLRRESLSSAARGMRVQALLLRSVDALAAVGVVPVLLKGYGAGAAAVPGAVPAGHHGRGSARGRGDRGAVLAARAGRAGADERQAVDADRGRHPPPRAHGARRAGGAALPGARGVRAGAGGAMRWWPTPRRRSWRASASATCARRRRLVYLALHASNHLLQRLAWLFDLKLLVLARPGAATGTGWWTCAGHGPAPPGVVRAGAPRAGCWERPLPEGAPLAPPRWQRRWPRGCSPGAAAGRGARRNKGRVGRREARCWRRGPGPWRAMRCGGWARPPGPVGDR